MIKFPKPTKNADVKVLKNTILFDALVRNTIEHTIRMKCKPVDDIESSSGGDPEIHYKSYTDGKNIYHNLIEQVGRNLTNIKVTSWMTKKTA